MPRTLALFVVTALLLAGCGEEQKQKAEDAGRSIGEKAGKTWNKVKEFSAEQKEEFAGWLKDKKPEMEATYEKAKKKAAEAGKDAEKAFDASYQKAKDAFAKIPEASKDGWQAARDAAAAAYEAFQREAAKHK